MPNEAWNAIKYKDKGVEQYEEFFDLYMNEWHRRTPEKWQFVVKKIMNRFGVAETSKPVALSAHSLVSPKGKNQ